jgi:hypothetical protein
MSRMPEFASAVPDQKRFEVGGSRSEINNHSIDVFCELFQICWKIELIEKPRHTVAWFTRR